MNQQTMTLKALLTNELTNDIDKQGTLIAHAHGLGLNCDGALAHAAIYHLHIPPFMPTPSLSLSLALSLTHRHTIPSREPILLLKERDNAWLGVLDDMARTNHTFVCAMCVCTHTHTTQHDPHIHNTPSWRVCVCVCCIVCVCV